MKRGLLLVLFVLLIVPGVFSLSSIGLEKNLTSQTLITASNQAMNCLAPIQVVDQIACRLDATHLIPIQSTFCAETVEVDWCQTVLYDAQDCLAQNQSDACFVHYANSYSVLEYDESDAYILFLLLDQINNVEQKHSEGNITTERAAFVIEKLTNIGHAQMRHEPPSLINILFSEYISFEV